MTDQRSIVSAQIKARNRQLGYVYAEDEPLKLAVKRVTTIWPWRLKCLIYRKTGVRL